MLLYPGERPIPASDAVTAIEVDYPPLGIARSGSGSTG